ncbi:hypothetical protein MGG_17507 [Pyricularia oryzae 70-15]|uniref:Uncharacterized protein n=1 Tax=Pyricularia oryzae (strain 70-15 / ATCC MYA-4617 / FGSC 8958) TaxID=242507 RepID=G4NDV2_PYRO7|nr:uncharacterized protein MGG_17507 [Pyricularia oryzae 70-15]EHA49334.1 hypothetical protein MGG_17507 [Pyricularia oryzae 70-15]
MPTKSEYRYISTKCHTRPGDPQLYSIRQAVYRRSCMYTLPRYSSPVVLLYRAHPCCIDYAGFRPRDLAPSQLWSRLSSSCLKAEVNRPSLIKRYWGQSPASLAGRSDPVKRGTTSLGNMTKATSLPPHRAQTTKQSTKWSQNLVQQESYILISDSVLPDGEPTARSQTVHNHLIITGASEKKNTKSWKLNLQ